ncbi:MAG: hypothetical protein DRO67_00965 [Candidatus Asgardarchaeum californiense]|nr:MAG: hypothetical protein DRO67_00965 [Candidatus Asgardarchaeum californiense]
MTTQSERRVALANLIQKYDTISASELVKYLESDYGIKTTRQTVTRDLKTDIDQYIDINEDAVKDSILGELNKIINVAYSNAMDGNMQAANTYNNLIKTKTEIIAKFQRMKLDLKEKERPIYKIFIGKPEEVDKKEIKDDEESKIDD